MQYKFKQKVSKEDYLAFYKYHVTKNFMSPAKIGFTIMFFLMLFSGFFFGKMEVGIGGVVLLILVILMYFRITRSGSKIYDQDPSAFEYDYSLDDVTVSFSTKDGRSSKMWTEFVKTYEDELYLYIFTKSNKGLMFVKKSIDTEIYNFIMSKVKENKKISFKK